MRGLALALLALTLAGCPGGEGTDPVAPSSTPPEVPGFEDETPQPNEVPAVTDHRPLEQILRDVEALACQGPDFEDPLREAHRLQHAPQRLRAEVHAQGPLAVPGLIEALAAAQAYPNRVGFRERRAFVCAALGALAEHDPSAVLAALLASHGDDQRRVAEAASAELVGDWASTCEREGHVELGKLLNGLR